MVMVAFYLDLDIVHGVDLVQPEVDIHPLLQVCSRDDEEARHLQAAEIRDGIHNYPGLPHLWVDLERLQRGGGETVRPAVLVQAGHHNLGVAPHITHTPERWPIG